MCAIYTYFRVQDASLDFDQCTKSDVCTMFSTCCSYKKSRRKSSHVSAAVSYELNNFRKKHFEHKNSKGILQTVTDGLFVPDKLAMCVYSVVRTSTSLLYTHAFYSAIHNVKFIIFTKTQRSQRDQYFVTTLPSKFKILLHTLNSPLPTLYLFHFLKFYLICSLI
jgi:hypothetical protein